MSFFPAAHTHYRINIQVYFFFRHPAPTVPQISVRRVYQFHEMCKPQKYI